MKLEINIQKEHEERSDRNILTQMIIKEIELNKKMPGHRL